MNCSNLSPENDKKGVFRSAYHKRYYAENRELILARQKRWRAENPEAMKARIRRWYENNKERLASSRKNNRERLNDYWTCRYSSNESGCHFNHKIETTKRITLLLTTVASNTSKGSAISVGISSVSYCAYVLSHLQHNLVQLHRSDILFHTLTSSEPNTDERIDMAEAKIKF